MALTHRDAMSLPPSRNRRKATLDCAGDRYTLKAARIALSNAALDPTPALVAYVEGHIALSIQRFDLPSGGVLGLAAAADGLSDWNSRVLEALDELEPAADTIVWEIGPRLCQAPTWLIERGESGLARWLLLLATVVVSGVIGPHASAMQEKPGAVVASSAKELFRITMPSTGLHFASPAAGIYSNPIAPAADADTFARVLPSLRTLTAHRLIRFFIAFAAVQKACEDAEPGTIWIPGGAQGLADRIGAKSKADATLAMTVLRDGQRVQIRWERGEIGGLWTFLSRGAASNRRAELKIALNPALCPDYTFDVGRPVLVPVVQLPQRWVGHRTRAAQAHFQQRIVCEIVAHRRDLAARGAAPIDGRSLAILAEEIGLKRSTAIEAMKNWTGENGSPDAVFHRVQPDLLHLNDNARYGDAKRFIDETAKRSAKNAARGRRAAANRSRGAR